MAIRLTVLFVGVCLASAAHSQTLERAVWPEPRPLEPAKLDRLGLRAVEGDRLTLVTDLPASPEIDELPAVVAATLPELAEYFSVAPESFAGWRLRGYLIADREKFAAAGLMPPPEHAEFPHALSMGYEVWVNHQPSGYYNRALLIHETTHSFMSTLLGGCGPGWYMEAVAELMGGHAWDAERRSVKLRILPADRGVAPYWGRVPLVRAAQGALTLGAVMKISNNRPLPVESYAAVWSLAKFMDAHPRYRDRFRKLPRIVLQQDFNDRFRRAFARDARALGAEYQLFAKTLVYGHDVEREAIDFRQGKPFDSPASSGSPRRVAVRADRGWQPSGVAVRRGESYRFQAKGRYVIAKEPDGAPWPCEANGITFTYHGGRPLGQLLAAVVDYEAPLLGGGLLQPFVLGGSGVFKAPASGTLLLRVNDSPAKLAENEGGLTVTLDRSKKP
ncbi:MAG: hypothetical protein AAF589_01740 [Planctomycetota bacterium]